MLATILVTKFSDAVENTPAAIGTLRQAIFDSNNIPGADEIRFDAGLNGSTITLSHGELGILESLTIDATTLPLGLTVEAFDPTPLVKNFDGSRVFTISGSASALDVTLAGLKITGADAAFGAGGIDFEFSNGSLNSSLTIRKCEITGNGGSGGGVRINAVGTEVEIADTTISGNTSSLIGGGVYAYLYNDNDLNPSTLTINRSTISNNTAVTDGGGIWLRARGSNDVDIVKSTISGNSAPLNGGGISLRALSSDVNISQSTISGNKSLGSSGSLGFGGGVYAHLGSFFDPPRPSTLTLNSTTISGNESAASGGGLFVDLFNSSTLTMDVARIINNKAVADGGGVSVRANEDTSHPLTATRSVTILRSLISGNTTLNRGGGLYAKNFTGTETLVEETRVTDNHVLGGSSADKRNGGGIYTYVQGRTDDVNSPTFTISRSTVDNNDTENIGGGIFVCAKYNGNFVATNSTISTNRTLNATTGQGGGVMIARFGAPEQINEAVDAFFRNVTITLNRSATGGGLRMANLLNVRTQISNSIISENYKNFENVRSDLVGRVDIANAKYNIVGTGSSILNLSGASASLDATNTINDAPLLSPLADYGGPTPTHALKINSPAIDKGSNALAIDPFTLIPFTTDQRGVGFTRLFNFPGLGTTDSFIVDVGAYELGFLRVTNVTISGSNSTHLPFSFNGPNDATDFDGSGLQLRTVPVGGADTITIQFSGAANVASDSLIVLGLRTGRSFAPSSMVFIHTPGTSTATWKFPPAAPGQPAWKADDNYLLHLADALVTDMAGNPLDGEWTNPLSTVTNNAAVSEFPSGNGTAGGNFQFVLTLLHGDRNLSNTVGFTTDINPALANIGMGSGMLWDDGDFNGNGTVGFTTDINPAIANLSKNLQTVWIIGDFNNNFDLAADDRAVVISHLTMTSGATRADGDLDGDGDVDGDDLLIWDRQAIIHLSIVS